MALQKQFKKHGYDYTLVKSEEDKALYSISAGKNTKPFYEVWVLDRAKKDNPFINQKIGDIVLPRTSQWGYRGWTFSDLKMAENKYSNLSMKSQVM